MEEALTDDIDAEAGMSGDDTDAAADEENPTVEVPGKGKRKVHDEGAETRKKKLLCKRAAEKKQSIDSETKSFIEGLLRTSVTSLGDMLITKMEDMESKFTERMGKLETEVSQIRDAVMLSAEGSDPSMSEAAENLLKFKGDQAACFLVLVEGRVNFRKHVPQNLE
ncbi:Uncharacterized protein Rs2_29625 [Raphanus sativus]|nr:Uncharacterized protein Rs2_29625 [Raphanus sativus]